MLKVASVSWTLADDVIFGNMSLVLYANGCKWACPGCHNKALQCFEVNDSLKFSSNNAIIAYLEAKIKAMPDLANCLTVVGSGGDFFFQLQAWLDLCEAIKQLYPQLKIIWYTGAEHSETNVAVLGSKSSYLDAILWGKLAPEDGYVIKYISRAENMHETASKTSISKYNSQFEEAEHG